MTTSQRILGNVFRVYLVSITTKNRKTDYPKSVLPTTSIDYLLQLNIASQNPHKEEFIYLDSVENYDDQIKKGPLIKSKNLKKGGELVASHSVTVIQKKS